ncbi:MAG TPA: hypothetical protein VLW50_11910 [Streptosporangiaceae bacterium]|nr:hypothetical protein [Streptosporangiaceae bacterium]
MADPAVAPGRQRPGRQRADFVAAGALARGVVTVTGVMIESSA